jgi:DNA-nicking Smr family endonuclease
MKIGDKVRMIHDRIEGIVIKIKNDKQVEIEDTDGFTFPVLKSDLIVVNPIENQYFGAQKTKEIESEKPILKQTFGSSKTQILNLAIVFESQNYGVYLLNSTNSDYFVATYGNSNSKYELLVADFCKANTKLKLGLFPLSKLESFKNIFVSTHLLADSSQKPSAKEFHIPIKASKIVQSNDEIYELNTKGFIKALANEDFDFDAQKLEKALNSKLENEQNKAVKELIKPENEIDLHAEALGIDKKIPSSEILRKQIQVFKQKLEAAIAHNFESIIFIHGVGDGVLKNEIYSNLQQYPDIKYFEDAQKSKFGYGATKIVLR